MKKLRGILLLMLLVKGEQMSAQGIFNQNGAWIKNQLKQIALWEIYIKDLEKGYDIAKEGLNIIGDMKQGDFHLHLDHFNALLQVNPQIKQYSKAIAIVWLQENIKELYPKTGDGYVNAVFSHLMHACAADAGELNKLLSPGNYAMTDGERISQIDKLYESMKDRYAFAKSFTDDIKMLTLQQLKEKNDLQTSRRLNSKIP